jgi:gamma-glutamylcyclotransferase
VIDNLVRVPVPPVIVYFAYGSNMSSRRLLDRVGTARALGIGTLEAYRLVFHKVSDRDGSGKGDIVECDVSHVMGMLFGLDLEAKRALDEHEGLGAGYAEKQVTIVDGQGARIEAVTYRATVTNPDLVPFTWYLRHVIEGATEAGLPDYYLQRLLATEAVDDRDLARARRELAIYE